MTKFGECKYKGSSAVVKIPEKINGSRVTEIGKDAFRNCENLKEIYLPASVKKIDRDAFPNQAKIIRYENSTTPPEKIIGCDNSTPLLEKIIALKKSSGNSEEIVKELEKGERILKLDIEKLVRDIISDVEYIIKIQDNPTPESKLMDLLNSVSSNVKISKMDCYAEKISPLEAHIKDNVKILTQGRIEYESE